MDSVGPHIPAHHLARNESAVDAEQPEAGPSIGSSLPPSATMITPPTLPVPRYEEEEDEDADVDDYAPELPPELAAARAANPSSGSGPRQAAPPPPAPSRRT